MTVTLTEEEKKTLTIEKRRETRARNAELKAEEDARAAKTAKIAEIARLRKALPELGDQYGLLLETLCKKSGFDRKEWMQLERLQNTMLRSQQRLWALEKELNDFST